MGKVLTFGGVYGIMMKKRKRVNVMYCPHCGTKLRDSSAVCTECGKSIRNKNRVIPPEECDHEPLNGWFVVLSLLVPIAGIILWLVKRKQAPKPAKRYGIIGLLSLVFNAFILLFFDSFFIDDMINLLESL